MSLFLLPKSTEIGKVIPKNSFDGFTNTKQKRLFTNSIQRITWTHKLSFETLNLPSEKIEEIQIFKIELKEKTKIDKLLEIINKVIPYHLICQIQYENEVYLSAASKHLHPTNDNISVIDWTFNSDWFNKEKNPYQLNLMESLDMIFKDVCIKISGDPNLFRKSMSEILEYQKSIDKLKKEMNQLKSAIPKCKQFNEKVVLNLKLKKLRKELLKLKKI